MEITVIIPCYNEDADRLREVVCRIPKGVRLVVWDDGSKPPSLLANYRTPSNLGKGAAIRSAVRFAGDGIIVLLDADGELAPEDIPAMTQPIIDGKADVVFGSRFLHADTRRVLGTWHYLATKALTLLGNMVSGLYLTDVTCGYKAFRRDDFLRLGMKENRFGFEPEFAMKVSKSGLKCWEVAVRYDHRRTKAEGKKVGVKDLFRHLYCIGRYGLFSN